MIKSDNSFYERRVKNLILYNNIIYITSQLKYHLFDQIISSLLTYFYNYLCLYTNIICIL